jgi:hypothetical protein
MRTTIARWAVSALLLVGGLSACGSSASSNGVASKSAEQIVAAATSAADSLSTVHVAGTLESGGMPITLNLELVSGKGGRGQMSEGPLSFQLVNVDQTVYINGGQAFWRRFGGAAAAQLFQGKWLKAPATGQFASIATLTDPQQLFNKLLSTNGSLAKGSTTTINGQKAIAVHDTTNGGTLYVATTGKPYPLEVLKPGAQGGQLTFDRFNQPVTLAAPANAIDISQFQK